MKRQHYGTSALEYRRYVDPSRLRLAGQPRRAVEVDCFRGCDGPPDRQGQGELPLSVSDPNVAWYNELDTIATTDGATGEVVCTRPRRLASIASRPSWPTTPTRLSPTRSAALANQIAEAADKAWLANTTAKANNGLLGLTYSVVDTGASVANLDPFIAARFRAQTVGAELTSWVMSPATAETLRKLKVQTGSNQTLLQFVNDGLVVAGLPVFVSPHVDAATVAWGIPKERVVTVLRKGTEVVRSKDAGFYNDAVDIRRLPVSGLRSFSCGCGPSARRRLI